MKFLSILSFVFALVFASPAGFARDKFSSDQVKQIQDIAHEYIVNNPQILIEAGNKLRDQEMTKRKEQTMSALPKLAKQLFADNLPGRAFIGNPKGSVVMVEFLSYQCGHCKAVGEVIDTMLKSHPELKVVFIEWPIFGNDAVYAAKAALAANKQNKFAEVHHALLKTQDVLNKANVDKILGKLKLDMPKLQKDMKDKALDTAMKDNFKLAQDLGLMGTPAFVFANAKLTKFSVLPGQTEDFVGDVEKAIKDVK